MNTLLIVLFVGLVACIVLRKSHPGVARIGIPLLAVIAVVVAGMNLVKNQGNPTLQIAGDIAAAQGVVLGEAVVQAFPDGGRLLVAQWESQMEPTAGIIRSNMEGFSRAIRSHGFEEVGVGLDPFASPLGGANEDEVMSLSELGIPATMVQGWLTEHGPVDAIVSFCSFQTDVYLSGIPSTTRIFVVAQDEPTQEMVDAVVQHSVTAVVLRDPESDWRVQPPEGSAREVFDHRYLLLTKDNVDQVQDRVGTVDPDPEP